MIFPIMASNACAIKLQIRPVSVSAYRIVQQGDADNVDVSDVILVAEDIDLAATFQDVVDR